MPPSPLGILLSALAPKWAAMTLNLCHQHCAPVSHLCVPHQFQHSIWGDVMLLEITYSKDCTLVPAAWCMTVVALLIPHFKSPATVVWHCLLGCSKLAYAQLLRFDAATTLRPAPKEEAGWIFARVFGILLKFLVRRGHVWEPSRAWDWDACMVVQHL